MTSVRIRHLQTSQADFETQFQHLLHWSEQADQAIEERVTEILSDVRQRGDAALLDTTRRFDGLDAQRVADLEISRAECEAALAGLPAAQRLALQTAAQRVRDYHERQLAVCGQSWSYRDEDGSLLGQKVTPLDRVGVYVPGGKAAYPSSVLMNALPAKVAGVGEIIMVVPTPRGERNPLVLAAAAVCGVDRVFTLGGAQAIAALAYGTDTVPAVDKITGPGNAYVASAKRRVFGKVGIDMIAGPSEILVLADGSTPADWVAMDLFSQAEHDELAQSILLTPDADYLAQVQAAIDRLVGGMPREKVIRASLEGRGGLILTRSMEEACEISNRIAPEHLEVSSRDPHRWEPLLKHAGAIFLGAYTSESLGDYCAGPNHVLPTSGTARFSSPLGVYDFQKRSSLIEVSAAGAGVLGVTAAELAFGEGLQAHAQAALLRMSDDQAGGAHGRAGPTPSGGLTRSGSSMSRADDDPAVDHDDLATRVERLVRPEVRAMQAYAVQTSTGLVKLDAMENPFTLPPALQDALGKRLGQVALNRYPGDRIEALRAELSRHAQLPPDWGLVLGNGSDELITLLAMACGEPGTKVLAPMPGFVMYELSARLQGMDFVGVPLRPDFSLDEPAMLAAIEAHRPALVYLACPNNPTANIFDEGAIERIVQAAPGLVVMDEAYQPFASRDHLALARRHPNVLVMRTLSKFGLAGVRLGYLLGPRAWTDQIEKVRPPYNVSVLNTEAALFALEHANEFTRQAGVIRAERERLTQALQAMGLQPFPSEANMILVRLPDAPATFTALKGRGVLVKDVSRQHALLANCLRLTVGTPQENDVLISALKASL